LDLDSGAALAVTAVNLDKNFLFLDDCLVLLIVAAADDEKVMVLA
jgi:hypothetical protein